MALNQVSISDLHIYLAQLELESESLNCNLIFMVHSWTGLSCSHLPKLFSIYLYNKYAAPVTYDMWNRIRSVVDWVCKNWNKPDQGDSRVANSQEKEFGECVEKSSTTCIQKCYVG